MKKGILAIAIVAIMISCGGKKQETTTDTIDLPIQSSEVLDQVINDGHNAKNSLDYIGTYRGTLPTVKGEAEIFIILEDSTYTQTISYTGKMSILPVETGKYTWNDAGTTITLESANAPNQYFVAENAIIQLDAEGNRVMGETADQYRLEKSIEE